MRSLPSHTTLFILLLFMALSAASLPVAASDVFLSNNGGAEDSVYFIKDEPSLVINGFDLTPRNVKLPTTLVAVNISVDTPIPGSSIDMVVYQDANGGSPIDARLAHRQTVRLDHAGVNRIELDRTAVISDPVIWVGFYLPVDFRFHADRTGPSVLTYWAWTPGGAFDVSSLANAQVLGPGDGSEPVAIEMEGIARITAETRAPYYDELATAFTITEQWATSDTQDLSALSAYDGCDNILYDPADNSISTALSFPMWCRMVDGYEAPHNIYNPPDQILQVERAGQLYRLWTYLSQEQLVPGRVSQLPVRVTHCLRIPPEHLERAVIAEVREDENAGDRWFMLPSVRVNEYVCAEISVGSYVSYFLPRADDAAPYVNLLVSWAQINPHPLTCGLEARFIVPVANKGTSWFKTDAGHVKVSIEDYDVATGVQTARYVFQINTDQLGPGARRELELGPFFVQSHGGTKDNRRRHRIEIRIDEDNTVIETNEDDNLWVTEYVMNPYDGPYHLDDDKNCADHKKVEKAARDAYNRGRAKVEFAKWSKACRRPDLYGLSLIDPHIVDGKRAIPPRDQIIANRCYKLEDGDYFIGSEQHANLEKLLDLCSETKRVCHVSKQGTWWYFRINRP